MVTDLWKYRFKNVVVEDVDGKFCTGYVNLYESELDNDIEEEYIGILPNKNTKIGTGFNASDIKSIKLADEAP